MRENAEAKARRYLTEGRLVILDVTGSSVTGTCRGDAALYDVTHHRGRGWRCNCPARGRCAPLLAAGLVVVVTPEPNQPRRNQ